MVGRKRIRAPGGGRKPKGPVVGKRATLSTRITSELRDYLDREAKATARSLSQEVELRLMATMGKRIIVQLPVIELVNLKDGQEEDIHSN